MPKPNSSQKFHNICTVGDLCILFSVNAAGRNVGLYRVAKKITGTLFCIRLNLIRLNFIKYDK